MFPALATFRAQDGESGGSLGHLVLKPRRASLWGPNFVATDRLEPYVLNKDIIDTERHEELRRKTEKHREMRRDAETHREA